MKRILIKDVFLTGAASVIMCVQAAAQPVYSEVEQSLSGVPTEMRYLTKTLSRAEADSVKAIVSAHVKAKNAERLAVQWENKEFTNDGYKLKFDYRVYGDKPADGRSLYISLHGGGKAPAEVNERQWRNQIGLYKPAEGVYLAPRAAVDDWNMWFQSFMDGFYKDIIASAVALMDVNPDKVYLMGYSAGGDGLYRMAPRLADRWAATSMMAGHPGVVDPVNLRNTPFMLWMGENDAAYDRNKEAVRFGRILDSLHRADSEGYINEVHIMKGKGHWMERADSAAVPWMAQFTRNPYPDKVVWKQDDSPQRSFYWLALPSSYRDSEGRKVIIERNGNRFDISENGHDVLYIGLNDEMIDFSKPVEVRYNGKLLFRKKVGRNAASIMYSALTNANPGATFSAYIAVEGNKRVRQVVP